MSEQGPAPSEGLAAHWEERYAGAGPVWSGRVNATVADIVSGLRPGRAIDLGCGEGGDAIWLAGRGWRVLGVDIAPTAVERARVAAGDAGLSADQVAFAVANLEAWTPPDGVDLVVAAFFHSTVEFARTDVLRRASLALRPGGHLLIVGHAAFPPWSDAAKHGHEHRFLSAAQEIAELDLDPGEWAQVVAEVRQREATGPAGEQAVLDDTVVLLRRRESIRPENKVLFIPRSTHVQR